MNKLGERAWRFAALPALVVAISVSMTGCAETQNDETVQVRQGEVRGIEYADPRVEAGEFALFSEKFANQGPIPPNYTCDGKGISPSLEILNEPPGTESMALIMDDPDAPQGTYTHWVIWNIPPGEDFERENTVPNEARLGINDSYQRKYLPPCPPSGTHRYHFRLYALDTALPLASGATREQLEEAMRGHIIEQTELVGTFKADIHSERRYPDVQQ